MINAFTLLKHPTNSSYELNLSLDSVVVAFLYFHNPKEIEVEYFLDENKNYLCSTKNGIFYIPLEWDTSKALYDLLADFPADFSRFEYSKKLVSE